MEFQVPALIKHFNPFLNDGFFDPIQLVQYSKVNILRDQRLEYPNCICLHVPVFIIPNTDPKETNNAYPGTTSESHLIKLFFKEKLEKYNS